MTNRASSRRTVGHLVLATILTEEIRQEKGSTGREKGPSDNSETGCSKESIVHNDKE